MPIYEFYCPACHKLLNFFARRVNTTTLPPCPHCDGALSRQVSAFSAPRNNGDASDELGDAPFDESKMADAMERFGDKLETVGDAADDPRKSAELLRQFSEASGLSFNKDMRDALRRLESGEDPDAVASDMESIVDSGADPFAPSDRSGAAARKSAAPQKDPTLYEM